MTQLEIVPTVQDRFSHILSAINTVQAELYECSAEELANNRVLWLALERLLEIISVASDHIPAEIKASEAKVDWNSLAGIGARLEDTRSRIEPETLLSIAREKLAPLKICAEQRVRV
jgi:uncharacterized protein with HEPN domain